MAGAASAAPNLKSDPPIHNLLRPKNGLDNGGHFRYAPVLKLIVGSFSTGAVRNRLCRL
jgi:hypothetical protein